MFLSGYFTLIIQMNSKSFSCVLGVFGRILQINVPAIFFVRGITLVHPLLESHFNHGKEERMMIVDAHDLLVVPTYAIYGGPYFLFSSRAS
jgi:hypothetical protein